MRKFYCLLIPLLVLFSFGSLRGQCPSGDVSATYSVVPNTCASNGSITVNLSQYTNVRLELLKDNLVLSVVGMSSNSHTFERLAAGAYQVKATCVSDLSRVYFTNDVQVAEGYVSMTGANVSVSGVCGSFKAGGVLTVEGVTGGTAPYTYSFYKSDDPAYDDTLSNYTTSNTMEVGAFGTYQIRIKDACGNYITVTREVKASLPPIELWFNVLRSACGQISLSGVAAYDANTRGGIDFNTFLAATGVKLKIQQDSSSGAVVYDGLFKGETLSFAESSTGKYFVTTVNACGEQHQYTLDYKTLLTPEIATSLSSQGCPPSESLTLLVNSTRGFVYPVTYSVINQASGEVVKTGVFNNYGETVSLNVPVGSYKVTHTDACGTYVEKILDNPKNTAPSLAITHSLNSVCGLIPPLTQTGGQQIYVGFRGYVPDLDNATLTIVSGPSNVGVKAVRLQANRYAWTNVLSGNYVISVESCGVITNYNITVRDNRNTLRQSLSSQGTSVCSGGGNITSTKIYNGGYSSTVQLLAADNPNVVLQENATGNFSNLRAGTYITRMKITMPSWCTDYNYYVPGSTITLTGAASGPKVSVLATTCEIDNVAKGTAYLSLSGVMPYTIKYRENGTTTWTTVTNISTSKYNIENLVPNKTYDVNITDACGNSLDSGFNVGVIADYLIENPVHPCIGSPYTLVGKDFPGATYEWTNPSGTVVSTTKDYAIASYNSSYDGTYKLKMTWDGCVVRTMEISVYSTLCGGPISQASISGHVFNDLNGLDDNTVNGTGIGVADGVQLYITAYTADENGENGVPITTVKVNSDGSYTIPGLVSNRFYKLIITTNPLGAQASTSSLPSGWVSTGENVGAGAGNDGKVDGQLVVYSLSEDNANFGIRKEFCFKPANVSGVVLDSRFGVTTLGRAGDNGLGNNWPMERKGAFMVLEGKDVGFVLNRVNPSDIQNPVEGMLVYDTIKDCISLYDGSSWRCLTKKGCPDL
ncbi:fibronectin type III domain-containing protein [Riemerella anatipestifer]|uniref:fibronectin type III domain-containing protein n=1 Tax=Riemerella anatipestifer TaxID=34085 RepID=UPI0030BE4D0A